MWNKKSNPFPDIPSIEAAIRASTAAVFEGI